MLTNAPSVESRYLELLGRALTRQLFDEVLVPVAPQAPLKRRVIGLIARVLRRRGLVVARELSTADVFADSPPQEVRNAETLIGPLGLSNLRELIGAIFEESVPGDLIETGAWRGGAAIYMRGVLAAHADTDRTVWVADSFRGLPPRSSTRYTQDDADRTDWAAEEWLAVSLETVKSNFERYGFLDERTRFLEGWFSETLPTAPIDRLALMRLDGDMYGSTMDALTALYPKLSVGGFVIIDDYWLPNCRAAVHDFRRDSAIDDEIVLVDRAIAYWRRTK